MTENINEKNDNRVVDMLLSRNMEASVDSDSMILETQKRVWGALKKGYEYSGVHDESEDFLRKNVSHQLHALMKKQNEVIWNEFGYTQNVGTN